MPVFHVELRSQSSGWLLEARTVVAETEEKAVAEVKKLVAYADQIPFRESVVQLAEAGIESVAEKSPEPVISAAEQAARDFLDGHGEEFAAEVAQNIEKLASKPAMGG